MGLRKRLVTVGVFGVILYSGTSFVYGTGTSQVDLSTSANQVQAEIIQRDIQQDIVGCKLQAAGTELAESTSEELGEIKKTIAEQKIAEEEKKKAEELEKELKATKSGKGLVYKIPKDWKSEFKAYMAYTAVTSKSSPQYKLLNSEDASTDENGLRMYKGRYCIAVGSGFASEIGTKIDLVLENDTVIQCVLGDQKADCDTVDNHMRCAHNGSVAEFIMDKSVFKSKKDGSGTVNWVTTEAGSFDGKIKKVIIVDESDDEVNIKSSADKDKKKKKQMEEVVESVDLTIVDDDITEETTESK